MAKPKGSASDAEWAAWAARGRKCMVEVAVLLAEAFDFCGTVEAFDAWLVREGLADMVAPANRAYFIRMGRDPDRLRRILADGLNAAFMVEGNGEADDLTDRPPAVPSRRRSTAQSA
jgi:hypothetical protein